MGIIRLMHKLKSNRRRIAGGKWALGAAVAAVCASGMVGWAADREPEITATVHPILSPTSAIQVPLRASADQTFVWQQNQQQRMLLSGHVSFMVGYRQLKSEQAAVWLTPSRESGEGVYDVAIYLSGNVEVREGSSASATLTAGRELLVTTRITQSVQLSGVPISQAQEDSPVVKRGAELRDQIANRPPLPRFLPEIVFTPEDEALQNGWIAKTDTNRIIAGPGEAQVVRDAQGNVIPGAVPPRPARAAPPRPALFVTGDEERTHENGSELVHILPNAYVFFDPRDGHTPLEFRANNVVVFTPNSTASQPASQPASSPAGSQPAAAAPAAAPPAAIATPRGAASSPAPAPGVASAPATAPATAPAGRGNNIAQVVTGIYFEGDVTLTQGDQISVRATRLYYDFTSNRAIMLDATLSTVDQIRNLPLYMRASEIRQLARGEYAAKKATFSTSEFFTPHYAIGASDVYLRDITPTLAAPQGGGTGGEGGGEGLGGELPGGEGGEFGQRTYQFQAKDATLQASGVPIFYWPYLAGDTSKNIIPLRTIRVSNSKTYGLSLLTDWDLFALAGQPEPTGVHADLNLDEYGKRGPAGGVDANWALDDDHGILRTYGMFDNGTDRLGADRQGIVPPSDTRGRATVRDQRDLGDGLTLQLEASYVSDPTFLEEFFQREFDADKENETSIYLKKQGETDAISFLGKFNLMDFTSTADQVDDQFTTEKRPEVKYWRIGDSFADMFTYYSETSADSLHTDITAYTPQELGLQPTFMGLPARVVPLNITYRDYYKSLGYNTGDVLRGDTRQEIDMPLQIGDAKVTPYVTGRLTAWNNSFPDDGTGGNTTRAWGQAGLRSSMEFWRVYDQAESRFLDVHRLRHIIEPQFILFASGSNQDRSDLQLFDRDVEGISKASGMQLALNQTWQTKRPGDPTQPGQSQWRDVDWITFNLSWNQFWNRDRTSALFPLDPLRGFLFPSRPELSLVANSINANATWRVGEHFRLMGETNYSLDNHRVEQAAAGLAVDQSPSLTYFLGNRFINALGTDEWTAAVDYQLTQKYRLITAESYDFDQGRNILSSVTLLRKFPRFNTAITVTYDANNDDTSVVFTAWPEGFPNTGFGNVVGGAADRR